MNVLVVGCGNMGRKRIDALRADDDIVGLVDRNTGRLLDLASAVGAPLVDDYRPFLESADLDAVIVSTPPAETWRVALDCLSAGKHVLCEKPLGRSLAEAERVTTAALDRGLVLKCGFNLRHDAGLEQAFRWMEDGRIGAPYFIDCAYVNGSVRVNGNRVGSLLDVGTHILDLIRWFAGEPTAVVGAAVSRHEYDIDDRDDNVFAILQTGTMTASMHCSFVRWRNRFRFEVSGEAGAIEVENLPKWGKQTVTWHRRVYPAGVPTTEQRTFENDRSWANEWTEFARAVQAGDLKWNGDGLAAMSAAELIRHTSRGPILAEC